VNTKGKARRERLKKWPLVTMLLLFVSLIAVGFVRSPQILAIWIGVWGMYGIVRLVIWSIQKLKETPEKQGV
jgi:hypothetical protein